MRIADALVGVSRLYLDTAPVVYAVERHPLYAARADEILDRIDAGAIRGVSSPITLAECLVEPIRQGLVQAEQNFIDLLVGGGNMTFVPIDATIARQAAELAGRYRLRLPDALQIAVAMSARCDAFLTNDLTLKRIQELPVLVLQELTL